MEKTIHQGHNVKRFRDMLGMKQDTLATGLGGDWTQKKVSLLEAKEQIDQELLEEVARVLKVPVEAIKNFDEEAAISIVANTFHEESSAYIENYKCTFNPIDKVVELYERMIKERDERIQELLNKK
jgi:transcriptional regulator with XRE-family HTH domain